MGKGSILPALLLASLSLFAVISCGGARSSPSSSPPLNPVFMSSPPSAADEASPYVYTARATDPANNIINYQLTTAPTGAGLSGATITWIPSGMQSRQPNSFAITATTAVGGRAVQNWSVTPSGVIHIKAVVTHVFDTGTANIPIDLSSDTLAAFVPNSAGGFDRIDGQGLSDGTGLIAHVPGGLFWFDQDGDFLWTSASNLDVSSKASGRSDVGVLNPNSTLSFSMSGLSPWQATDQVVWNVTNAGQGRGFAPIPTGSTTFTTLVSPYIEQLDANRGDQQVFTQLVTHSVLGWPVLTLDKSFGPIPISIPAGTVVSITAPLSDPPRSSVRASFGGSAFQALVKAVNPRSLGWGTEFELDVEPGPTPHEPLFSGPSLALFDILGPAGIVTSDLDLGDVSYGNPFDSAWPVFLRYSYVVNVSYTPSGIPAAEILAGLSGFTTDLPTLNSPVQPIVGPPVDLRINGVDFFQDQTAVGLMPTLQWDPPIVGSATEYQIQFCFFLSHPNASMCNGILITNTTTVTVPPGVLLAGKQYFVRVTAISQPGLDASTAPFKTAFPRGTADALSGIISP